MIRILRAIYNLVARLVPPRRRRRRVLGFLLREVDPMMRGDMPDMFIADSCHAPAAGSLLIAPHPPVVILHGLARRSLRDHVTLYCPHCRKTVHVTPKAIHTLTTCASATLFFCCSRMMSGRRSLVPRNLN